MANVKSIRGDLANQGNADQPPPRRPSGDFLVLARPPGAVGCYEVVELIWAIQGCSRALHAMLVSDNHDEDLATAGGLASAARLLSAELVDLVFEAEPELEALVAKELGRLDAKARS